MERCWLVISALLVLAACGGVPKSPVYPARVAGNAAIPEFKLLREVALTGDLLPPYVPPAGLIRAVNLLYEASNPVQLKVFETKSSSVAFEALQTWRPLEGRRAMQVGRFFVEAQMEKPDPATLDAFLTDFERKLQ